MLPDFLSAPQLVGYAAFVLGVGCFLQKNDRRFKMFMAGECVAYVIHFWLLGNPTAVASSLVSTTRSVLAIYTRSIWVALAIVAINLTLGASLAKHAWNWLPLIASCVGTLALFLLEGVRMRVMMLIGTLLWIANNVIAGSVGGTALELIVAAVNCFTIVRMLRQSQPVRQAS